MTLYILFEDGHVTEIEDFNEKSLKGLTKIFEEKMFALLGTRIVQTGKIVEMWWEDG